MIILTLQRRKLRHAHTQKQKAELRATPRAVRLQGPAASPPSKTLLAAAQGEWGLSRETALTVP